MQAPTISVGLKQGSTGPEVKSLQESLIAAGVTVAGGADGIFGPGNPRRRLGVPVGARAGAHR